VTRQDPAGAARQRDVETARLVHGLQVQQTELERQKDELRACQAKVEAGLARYTDLYDSAPVGYLTWDREGAIRRVNLIGATMLGVDRSRLVGRRFGLFVAEADRRTFENFRQRVFAGAASERCEVTLLEGSPEPRFVEISGTRSADGTECLAVIVDLTGRELAKEVRRESDEQLRAMFNLASVGLAQADVRTGRFLRVNDKMCAITGYSASEMLAMRFSEITHSEDRERAWDAFQRVVRGEQPDYRLEKRYLRKDGRIAWVNVNVSIIRDASGQALRTIASIEDITERRLAAERTNQLLSELDASHRVLLSVVEDQKRAEAALVELNTELEQRVVGRTAELVAANDELESFAYAVSHDLRAPLRAMSGFSTALTEDYGASLPDEARGFLGQIQQASQTMGELIDGLLVLSRSIPGELRHGSIDVSAMAIRVCQELARAEPARAVAWSVEDSLTVWGDARLVEVVLKNLLSNAWKYTTSCAAPTVRVYAEREGDRVWHCVSDNGAGFDMKHADLLFKPFQRLHRQDEFPGIGIGLATVRRAINRHGGRVRARAAVNQGATFSFFMPPAGAGRS
jgi:PAS domain S-box-containing protein